MKLEWRWKCQPSPNSKKTTADVLDFLLDANIRLSVRLNKCIKFFGGILFYLFLLH